MPEEHAPKKSSWFGRNWRWVLPGCALALLAVLAGLLYLVLGAVSDELKHSSVYESALDRALKNAWVVEALGAPVTDGFYVRGEIIESSTGATANLWVPLDGSKAHGKLHIAATRTDDVWTYRRCEAEIPEGTTTLRIDLRTAAEIDAAPR